jgi:hypothetical protein
VAAIELGVERRTSLSESETHVRYQCCAVPSHCKMCCSGNTVELQ